MDKKIFQPFIDAILKVNKDINLISRDINEEEFFKKHIVDSVKLLDFFDFSNSKTLLDIGAGGGIPGIPLAIALPDIKVTLFDSVEKKMRASQQIIDEIGIKNVKTLVGRTEEKGHQNGLRESFDIVTARAVASLPTLLEYALPFVKVGGHFIAYKGKNFKEELSNSKYAMDTLGGKLADLFKYELPDSTGERAYIVFEKIKPTPEKYPRRVGIPKKTPLIR